MTKALVIVDMLNDFVAGKEYYEKQNPGTSLAEMIRFGPVYEGKLVVAGAEKIIDNIALLKTFAERNGLVVYANDAHAEDDPEFKAWPKHSVKGTIGAKVIDELVPSEKALIVEKQDLSMFTNKEADKMLRQKGIDELYLTGVATEYCVRAAALDARKLGYKVNVVVDAVAGVDLHKGDQYKALLEMGNAGARAVSTKQALEELVR